MTIVPDRQLLAPDSTVIVHLVHPAERLWGVIRGLDASGVVVRGLPLDSFDAWMREVAQGGETTLGLSTQFVPMQRVERIYLDETVGATASYSDRFAARVGVTVEAYLGLDRRGAEPEVPS